MGLFSFLGSAVSSIGKAIVGSIVSSSGSSSGSYQTIYEPDKVKAAEIEQETKLRLANKELDRIEMMKQAQLDILAGEAQSRQAIEEAKARGFTAMAQTIVLLQDKMNELAEKRLKIIECGSLAAIKDANQMYDAMTEALRKENEEYSAKKLPLLLQLLEQYEKDSAAYQLYMKRIDMDMAAQTQYYSQRLSSIMEQQNQIIAGIQQSKEHVLEQTDTITAAMLNTLQQQQLALESKVVPDAIDGGDLPSLGEEKKILSQGKS